MGDQVRLLQLYVNRDLRNLWEHPGFHWRASKQTTAAIFKTEHFRQITSENVNVSIRLFKFNLLHKAMQGILIGEMRQFVHEIKAKLKLSSAETPESTKAMFQEDLEGLTNN